MKDPTCFKAYDIRGRVPEELDRDLAWRVGRAFAALHAPGSAVVGHDVRLTSPDLADALIEGLRDGGVHVHFIGLCGTEEVYHAVPTLAAGGGIMVTASHNPREWNGMKLVGAGSAPLGGEELAALRDCVAEGNFPAKTGRARVESVDTRPDYVSRLLSFIRPERTAGLRIVADAGNGGAGAVLDALAARLPATFVRLRHAPDGNFPDGVPNPLLPENRAVTAAAVVRERADFGVAWDGDFDRCFFFDHTGGFVEGYYMVALLAARLLETRPGEPVVHDPRLYWNTVERVRAAGGRPVVSRTGHAFMKAAMRAAGALYGGEMSAHHYFRDFHHCDSGMIPWLLVADLVGGARTRLAALVGEMSERYPVSGEINRAVPDVAAALADVEAAYAGGALAVDRTDGLGMEFAEWRFNLRGSNTEPLLRLNVETRGDRPLLAARTGELLARIDRLAGGAAAR